MRSSAASKSKGMDRAATPQIVVGEGLGDLSEAIHQAIAHRAYELYEARGGQHGYDLEDWFRAEAELQQPVAVIVSEAAGVVIVRIELSGFPPEEIRVGIKPHCVIIWGQKEHPFQQETEKTPHAAILRVIDLSSEVDTTKGTATFEDGKLVLTLPTPHPTEVQHG